MTQQDLEHLLQYHRNTDLARFAKDLYPDFNLQESPGYLSEKFSKFQHDFTAFLSELDQKRLVCLADAVNREGLK